MITNLEKDFNAVWKGDASSSISSSPFIKELYSNPEKLKVFKDFVNKFHKVTDKDGNIIDRRLWKKYKLPLKFRAPLFLSTAEDKIIREAIHLMSVKINQADCTVPNTVWISRYEVSDKDQRDLPMPDILIHMECPEECAPADGFYIVGKFRKEKNMKEIVAAQIQKIIYYTKDGKEMELMTFTQ